MKSFSHEITEDIVISLSKRISKTLTGYKKTNPEPTDFYFVSDEKTFFPYYKKIFAGFQNEYSIFVTSFEELSNVYKTANGSNVFFPVLDFTNGNNNTKNLKLLLDMANKTKATVIVSCILPSVSGTPGGITRLAEREFSYYIETNKQESEKFSDYISAEKLCREAVHNGNGNIVLIRFFNLFGPGVSSKSDFDINEIIKNAGKSNELTVSDDDCVDCWSYSFIGNALFAPFQCLIKARKGHVYNYAEFYGSSESVKNTIRSVLPEVFSFNASLSNGAHDKTLHGVSFLKFSKLGTKLTYSQKRALLHSTHYLLNTEYDISRNLEVYDGKLQRLKSAEIEMLKEIDKICRENNIQYFLAGGSLLGAIRNGKSIPWDDDLDIGMLREDFEKFRKVAPPLFNGKYIYSSPFEEKTKNAHYYLDKIRLKNSYFSTKYSNNFLFDDGVFLDVIVYDKTSNNRILEKIQIKEILMWIRLINIKWINKPRKKIYRRFSKYSLPFLRMIPFMFFHKAFDRAAMRYYKNKKSEYLIDSFGQHIRNGRFPKECLETVQYVQFDGIEVPIPTGYDTYLSFFYGHDYKNLPPISSRLASHDFSRLDLGEYVFNDHNSIDFREVNINGELFEDEI